MFGQPQTMDVTGQWYGTYYYSGLRLFRLSFGASGAPPGHFRAVFQYAGGGLAGNIIDDTRMALEASITGRADGYQIEFVKTYFGKKRAPITYRGVISPDGSMMTGEWSLSERLLGIFGAITWGTWEARRYNPV